jgi:hypothetical protein
MRFSLLLLTLQLSAVDIPHYATHDFSFNAPIAGNPFDVALTGHFTGPNGERITIPGFYDGGGVWKIRFSPTAPGKWTMRTVSPAAALDGRADASIECIANPHPHIRKGGLRVDPAHPYHFVHEDGSRYFLLGYEADWLWGVGDRMHVLIDQLSARGFNHVLVNVYGYDTSWSPGKKHEFDFGPPSIYPWEGANERPDHAHLNPSFFQHYDRMIRALQDKGIVAHIMLKVYNKKVKWPEKWSVDEERYFRYLAARYQAFQNVVWDFAKESYNEKDEALQSRLTDIVRGADAYHRLFTAHDDDLYSWSPDWNRNLDFRTDQQHSDFGESIAFERSLRKWPILNSEFGYERGVDKFPTYRTEHDWQEQLRRGYLVYFAGGYGVYYYHNTAWDVFKPEPEPPGMPRFQQLRQILEPLPYWRMEPSNELAFGGPCLALRGEAYAFYVEGSRLTANLSQLAGAARAEWIDTWTGAREPVKVSAGILRLTKPESFGKAPAVLVVRKNS